MLNTYANLSNAIIVSFPITIADAGCGFFSASTISSAALEISSLDDICGTSPFVGKNYTVSASTSPPVSFI